MLFPLRPHQESALDGLRRSLSSGHRRPTLQLPTGAGKCLGRGTPVLMFDGSIAAVEDIAIGDRLMGPDSGPRRVLSVCRGREALFRVVPVKGDPYVVNESHILSLKLTGGVAKTPNPGRRGGNSPGKIINIEVVKYIQSSATFKHLAKGWRPPGIDFSAFGEQLRIAPYFLGLWLGDGLSRRPTICTGDQEVEAEIVAFADVNDLRIRLEYNSERSNNFHLVAQKRGKENTFRSSLAFYDLIRNKHVPHSYKTASRRDRLELLAGVLDTDGHLGHGGFALTLKDEHLVDDVVFVARSLGFSAFKRMVNKTCSNNGVCGSYFTCHINGEIDQIPCRIARKQATARRQKKSVLLTGIERVEPLGEGDYFGFEIDGDRLFLLGDFTVTHNTVVAAHIIAGARAKRKRVGFAVPALSLIDQTFERFRENGIDAGDMGVMQADHPWRRPNAPIQICSIQTIAKRGPPEVDFAIIDENHLQFDAINRWMLDQPDKIFVGLSATPWARGMGDRWDDLIIPTSIGDLIEQGYLSKFRVFAPTHPDLSGVKIIAGDYHDGQLSERMSGAKIVADVVTTWLEKGDNQPTLCFAVDRGHAQLLHDQFASVGVTSAYVDANTDREERAKILGAFQRGEVKVINSIGTMTTGVDVDCRCIIMARPTKSEILFVQCIGRGLRTAPGKEHCIILDHSDTHLRLGMVTDIYHDTLRTSKSEAEEKKAKKKPDTVPTPIECVVCACLIPVRAPECPNCGYVPKRACKVVTEDGELLELGAAPPKGKREPALVKLARQGEQEIYSQLLAMQGTKKSGWVSIKFKAIFDKWPPRWMINRQEEPSSALRSWVCSENIKWAKSRPGFTNNASDSMELAHAD